MHTFKQKLAKFDKAIGEVERENCIGKGSLIQDDSSLVDLFIDTINKSASLLFGKSSVRNRQNKTLNADYQTKKHVPRPLFVTDDIKFAFSDQELVTTPPNEILHMSLDCRLIDSNKTSKKRIQMTIDD